MQKQINSIADAAKTAKVHNADALVSIHAVSGYQITQQLYAGSRTLVYRAIRESDRNPVILKLLRNEMPIFSELVQFRNQYAIMRGITDSESSNTAVIQPYSLEHFGNGYVLVMEDFGGISLSQFTQGHPLEIAAFLDLAIQLTDILHHLYKHRVIHKDIKPANILIHEETKQVKLIDFSISSLLPRESQEIQNPNVLEGTLSYLSPEQTGRMNRGIDYRSDFYSLGVTFYQLLAGQLPFQSDDPMELVHSHLAVSAIPAHRVNPKVPAVLSRIVAKLMAKNAEDRYQSAIGLKRDLENCLQQWNQTGTIAEFKIGQEDRCDRFTIPEKLYGRETEVAALLAAFDRVANPPDGLRGVELMLVAGFSGIGKTAAVNEIHKPIVRGRGYFIKGKYDQFQRNIPFSAFVQSFRDLMAQLLGESKVQLQQWRSKILVAVGENGQVIIDVIPELERIIGKQPPVVELSGSAAQNRFNLLFQNFLQVFTAKEHPLVMFLDDLQWADSASLSLLKLLLSETETGYLLLLAAYRDNEVFPAHPLMLTLEEIKKAAATINTITLAPLNRADINQLAADTLNCSTKLAQPLGELTYQKTQANPFFATQFLKALHGDRLITFNYPKNYWECNLAQVKAAALTSDVVEFMAVQLQKLPVKTQEMLKLAACIGNSFDLTTLAIVSEKSLVDAAADFWKALQEGLILPISETYKFFQNNDAVSTQDILVPYKFLHDRVQQAAYSLIPEDRKQATHLKIGQLLLEKTSPIDRQEKLFDIVNHLNIGKSLIDRPSEREELAQLNLAAGSKAKSATAYSAAIACFATGIELLEGDRWQSQYQLTLALHEAKAEAIYLTGEFEQLDAIVNVTLKSAKTLLDKIAIYETQIQAYLAQNRLTEAIQTALNVLKQLGIQLPQTPNMAQVLLGLAKTKLILAGKKTPDLVNLPTMTNPEKLAAMRILSSALSAAFIGAPKLLPLLVFQQVNLSVRYGNMPLSAFAYAWYGTILCGVLVDVDAGYEFGQLGLGILERFHAQNLRCKTVFMVNCFIIPWKQRLQLTLSRLQEAYQSGVETGDVEYGAWAALVRGLHFYWSGHELSELEPTLHHYAEAVSRSKQNNALVYINIYRQSVLNLMGQAAKPSILDGPHYWETQNIPMQVTAGDRTGLFFSYVNQLHLRYLFGEFDSAIATATSARQYEDAGTALLPNVPLYLYDSLARLAVYSTATQTERSRLLHQVTKNQKKLQKWAQFAPMNSLHKFQLVEAERYRVLKCNTQAIDLYDLAILGAKENEYIQEEALANELAAKFYLDWGKEKVASSYMQEAYYCYARWGAKAKVEDLETRYPQLLSPILQRSQISDRSPLTTSGNTLHTLHQTNSSGSTSISNLLDLGTMLKAAQTLYSEIHLDKLLANLMQFIVENSGADKAALYLDRDGELEVVIKYLDRAIQSLEPKPLDDCQHFPTAIIHYVDRTLETVITDAKTHPCIVSDRYFIQNQPQSLLCTPILNQGKSIGVLYLENSLTSGAFTSYRVELLKFLCSQAAISLENARLYQKSQNYTAQLSQKSQQLEQTLAELQTMQLQLVQNEKMSALGNLVAGVAHEINNPVGCIIGNVNATQDYLNDLLGIIELYQNTFPQPGAEIEDELEAIDLDYVRSDLPTLIKAMKDGGDRITSISKSLRTFSRADSDTKQYFNLHEGIDSTLLILRHRLKANERRPAIEVVTDYGKLPEIACFPGQMNQVFMNLLANAIDALDESNLGRSFAEIQANPDRITIRTVVEGNCVKIAIADNGTGMSSEVKNHIFDHLFTTKAVGKGTGLGLAIARQIVVEKHGGAIEVDSALGKGTTFTIKLAIEA